MNKTRGTLLGIFVLCLGAYGTQSYLTARAEALEADAMAQRTAATSAAAAAAEQAAKLTLQRQMEDASVAKGMPQAYPRPVSDWQQNERHFHEKVLSGGKYDVLIVPFQVMGWAFDRSVRSLMTAELSIAMAKDPRIKIPDPFLVARALGDGQRQIHKEDVYRLADLMEAKRIVWGYAGHDRQGKMALALATQEYGGHGRAGAPWTTQIKTRRFENLPLEAGQPPSEVYGSQLPEIMKTLGFDASTSMRLQVESRLDVDQLPATPGKLLAMDENPARDAYYFLLWAQLTPERLERTKERLTEKAYLALQKLSPTAPEYRALKARIYMALGFRPAARKVLGEPASDEEKGVLATLNGNLPQLREIGSREKNQLKRVLLKLDENRIGKAYGVINQKQSIAEVTGLRLPGEIWPYITTRAFLDLEGWAQFDNIAPKMILDAELPVKGYSLEDVVRGAVSLGDPAKIQAMADLSILNHGRKLVEEQASRWRDLTAFDRPDALDYLDLLQAIGHANLMRRIDFLARIQGRPGDAIAFANSIDTAYKGNPHYTVERARAESALAEHASPAEKEVLVKSAYTQAFNAMYWEQGQSLISARAMAQIHNLHRKDYGNFDDFYYTDIPFRPYYWKRANGGITETYLANNLAALSNATWEFYLVADLAKHYRELGSDRQDVDDLLKSIEGRFAGSPQKNELLAQEAQARGDIKSVAAFLRTNIQLAPNHWESYRALGKQLYEIGDVSEAFRVVRSYPGFSTNTGESRVGIANDAFEMGSLFYWSGHLDLAIPLYKISASQNTGADGELSSDIRLKLLAGDIQGAMAGSLARAKRYNNSYAYRDYLGILHASGQSKQAWAGFSALVRESQKPHIWETALVGHRIAGVTEKEVVEWAGQGEFKGVGEKKNAAAIYLLRHVTTDRIPSQQISESINQLDRPVWQVESPTGQMVLRAADGERSGELLGPDAYGGNLTMPLNPGHDRKRRVKSDMAFFAEAYRELKLKNYPAAKLAFDEAAALFDLTAQSIYMLPYYALAAAKAGDGSGVERVMRMIKVSSQSFDYFLAKSILAGAAGNTEEAFQALSRARYLRPHTEDRPLLTQYTYGEVAGLVFELTGDARVRRLALDWVKKLQKIEPWHAWAYAMEATLAADAQDRRRAIAMAHYLDPKSTRLSSFDKAEIEAAVKAFGGANSFRFKITARSQGGAT